MLKLLLFLFFAYVLLITLAYVFERKLIFFPSEQDFKRCPEIIDLKTETFSFDYKGEKLRFYLHRREGARAWILHFHGNAGAACHRAFYIREFFDVEANIILAEYPGYSNDTQTSTENSILNNARALFQYLQSINKNNLPIILYGESLGCGVAINLASREKVAGLILQTPYTSISDIAKIHYPFLPIRWLIKNNFPANKWAKEVYTNVLILHGVKDDIIPIKIGRKLVTNFPHPPQFEEFSEFGHNDLNLGNSRYWQVVKDFISQITN